MTDREKIIAWLKDDSNGDRVAAFRTLNPGMWVVLCWKYTQPVVCGVCRDTPAGYNHESIFAVSPSGPWEPAPDKVVWRGTGVVFGDASDEDIGWLCESKDAASDPEMMLDIDLIRDFIRTHTPFKVTIEADE